MLSEYISIASGLTSGLLSSQSVPSPNSHGFSVPKAAVKPSPSLSGFISP